MNGLFDGPCSLREKWTPREVQTKAVLFGLSNAIDICLAKGFMIWKEAWRICVKCRWKPKSKETLPILGTKGDSPVVVEGLVPGLRLKREMAVQACVIDELRNENGLLSDKVCFCLCGLLIYSH